MCPAGFGSRPRIASDVTLLPQPDSPTIPIVSCGARSNDTPLTAWTRPEEDANSTRRSRTARSVSFSSWNQPSGRAIAPAVIA